MAQNKETPMEVETSIENGGLDTVSTTTISTVAVQAGKAKIVLAILKVCDSLLSFTVFPFTQNQDSNSFTLK